MRRWNAELERREAVRMPTRLACVVRIGSDRYEGVLELAHTLRGLLSPSVVAHVRKPTDDYLRWADAPTLVVP